MVWINIGKRESTGNLPAGIARRYWPSRLYRSAVVVDNVHTKHIEMMWITLQKKASQQTLRLGRAVCRANIPGRVFGLAIAIRNDAKMCRRGMPSCLRSLSSAISVVCLRESMHSHVARRQGTRVHLWRWSNREHRPACSQLFMGSTAGSRSTMTWAVDFACSMLLVHVVVMFVDVFVAEGRMHRCMVAIDEVFWP